MQNKIINNEQHAQFSGPITSAEAPSPHTLADCAWSLQSMHSLDKYLKNSRHIHILGYVYPTPLNFYSFCKENIKMGQCFLAPSRQKASCAHMPEEGMVVREAEKEGEAPSRN